jgi:hypothetical protein
LQVAMGGGDIEILPANAPSTSKGSMTLRCEAPFGGLSGITEMERDFVSIRSAKLGPFVASKI